MYFTIKRFYFLLVYFVKKGYVKPQNQFILIL